MENGALVDSLGLEQGADEEAVRVGLALEPPVAGAGDEGERGGAGIRGGEGGGHVIVGFVAESLGGGIGDGVSVEAAVAHFDGDLSA